RALRLSAYHRIGLAIGWLLLLALARLWLGGRAQVSSDLLKFVPAARTPAQKLLLDELGDGPGARLLMVAVSRAEPDQLAAPPHPLRDALAADPQFDLVNNGAQAGLNAFPERLLPYRYLLTPLPADAFSGSNLREELQARLKDLGSPVGGLVE